MAKESASESRKKALERLKSRKSTNIEELIDGVLKGDRSSLSSAITLIESNKPEHRSDAAMLINKCLPYSGNSVRIGITGVPGVGKSTFIESFGKFLTSTGHKVAILAIDPTSHQSKGSILGDKTRMEQLSRDPNAFIRPTPSSEVLGGVARCTRETMMICEAAGYDYIIIETVGVGQSEISVNSMVDFFLLLMLAGAGDELQGIKRGIMEMAHGIVITKADGENVNRAKKAQAELRAAVHLLPGIEQDWETKVSMCSAMEGTGLKEIKSMIDGYFDQQKTSGAFLEKRARQDIDWMHEALRGNLLDWFYNHKDVKRVIEEKTELVKDRQSSPFQAASEIIDRFLKEL